MKEADDLILVRMSLEGDVKAFEAIVLRYQTPIYHVALRIINDRDGAEDVTQTTFLKAFENLKTFNPKYKFFSWLYRIAINEALNFLNQNKSFEELSDEFVSDEKTLEELFDEGKIIEDVQQALMALNPIYRIPIVLKHIQGLSYKEISDVLDIPEKTVKSRLFTGRQLLAKILRKAKRP